MTASQNRLHTSGSSVNSVSQVALRIKGQDPDAVEDPRLWACRLDDSDRSVPKRSWTTEVGLGIAPNGEVLFGCRLLCITLGEYQPYIASIPGFVRQIAERFEASFDGRKAHPRAWIIVVSRGSREDPLISPARRSSSHREQDSGSCAYSGREPEGRR